MRELLPVQRSRMALRYNSAPPDGVLEVEERITAGLERETLEETGLSVAPLELTGVYKNMRQGIVALVFRCKAIGGRLTLNDEVSDFKWATREEIKTMATEAFAERALDALDAQPVPAVRQHDGVRLL
jgi:8-oxo-dGTP diphosphatase